MKKSDYAALDLGSNSFRITVVRRRGTRLRVEHKARELVSLALGMTDGRGRLSWAAQRRALACLERFAPLLAGLPRRHVRAVGTSALRVADNAAAFVRRASAALGHPIEVIAAREEARLVCRAVGCALEPRGEVALTIDIGGGSTEWIVGRDGNLLESMSMNFGCANLSQVFFPRGEVTRAAWERACEAVRDALGDCRERGLRHGWRRAVATLDTLRVVSPTLPRGPGGLGSGRRFVTGRDLGALRDSLLSGREVVGLNPKRRPVFPGGVAILSVLLEELAIDRLTCVPATLGDGILYELSGVSAR